MYVRDTIAAVSTPPGNGGIGIVRVSGAMAATIGESVFEPVRSGGLESHRFYFGTVLDRAKNEVVDEAMAVLMRAPSSYTREDVLEIHCHGGWLVVEKVLSLVIAKGARLADPGEFTRRAFLNGRIDLTQAEAVMDIIASKSEAALKLAQQHREGHLSTVLEELRGRLLTSLALVEAYIDFPEDDLGLEDMPAVENGVRDAAAQIDSLLQTFNEGRLIREGLSVLIAGRPNVGKSSLLNCLLKENRAIVTHVPGTTRDIIEETVSFGGLAVRLIDTAGIRATDDPVEREGISRAVAKMSEADIVLAVFDLSTDFCSEDQLVIDSLYDKKAIAVFSKADLPRRIKFPDGKSFAAKIDVSVHSGEGIENLKQLISRQFISPKIFDSREYAAISRGRHHEALLLAQRSLQQFASGVGVSSLEILALDLREALQAVGTVTGQTATDDILDQIFSSFCIGK